MSMRYLRRKWSFRVDGHKQILVKKSGEREEHVLMKAMMAQLYAPNFDAMKIEVRLPGETKYKPDVLAVNLHEEALFWGECGRVGQDKLKYLLKHYRHTHLAVAKWDTALVPFADMIAALWPKNNREASVDLIRLPGDSRELVKTDGSISITWRDVERIQWGKEGRITDELNI